MSLCSKSRKVGNRIRDNWFRRFLPFPKAAGENAGEVGLAPQHLLCRMFASRIRCQSSPLPEILHLPICRSSELIHTRRSSLSLPSREGSSRTEGGGGRRREEGGGRREGRGGKARRGLKRTPPFFIPLLPLKGWIPLYSVILGQTDSPLSRGTMWRSSCSNHATSFGQIPGLQVPAPHASLWQQAGCPLRFLPKKMKDSADCHWNMWGLRKTMICFGTPRQQRCFPEEA